MSSEPATSDSETTFQIPGLATRAIPEADLQDLRRLSLWNSISKQERDFVVAGFVLRGATSPSEFCGGRCDSGLHSARFPWETCWSRRA